MYPNNYYMKKKHDMPKELLLIKKKSSSQKGFFDKLVKEKSIMLEESFTEKVSNNLLDLYIPFSENTRKVKLLKRIFEGITADVFIGEIIENSMRVAVKRFKGEKGALLGEKEKNILEQLMETITVNSNVNFCQMFGYNWDLSDSKYKFNLAVEYGKETLYESLKKKKYTMEEIAEFTKDMIMIFSGMQKLGLFYRDIKPANILITDVEMGSKCVKIIDFDVAVWLADIKCDDQGKYNLDLSGTARYFPPELNEIFMKLKVGLDNELKTDTLKLKKKKFSIFDEQIDVPYEVAEKKDITKEC